ncbi:MAG: hypothetical protein IPI50_13965 [Saprospiraceae bacterium]|nr:hypothetical protein [Saprospiraceae bacterium]
MHDIEPYYHWRGLYDSAEDEKSPFAGQIYSEFNYTNKIYNYYIHPQWDNFGSANLYIKILYIDYDIGFTIIELIGEWNDCIENDIMYLKRDVIDKLLNEEVVKFMLICENVLNFHGSDDCYYEEWKEDVDEQDGWICFINTLPHVQDEMKRTMIHHYVNFGKKLDDIHWRKLNPQMLYEYIEQKIL